MTIMLMGNVGRLYAGYKPAATIHQWRAVREDAPLNNRVTRCTGRLTVTDGFWITQPITRMALRIGRVWWVWEEVSEVSFDTAGGIAVRAAGEPELVNLT